MERKVRRSTRGLKAKFVKCSHYLLVESGDEDEEFDSAESALGQEFVNKIEVNYCSLCREYLTRTSKDEKIIADHCKTKRHLKWYYQSKKKDEAESRKAEAAKEAVSSTSAHDVEIVSKKQISPDKEAKTVKNLLEDEVNITSVKKETDDSIDETNEKFTR